MKKKFIIVKNRKIHVYEGIGHRDISNLYDVPIATLHHWIRKAKHSVLFKSEKFIISTILKNYEEIVDAVGKFIHYYNN